MCKRKGKLGARIIVRDGRMGDYNVTPRYNIVVINVGLQFTCIMTD